MRIFATVICSTISLFSAIPSGKLHCRGFGKTASKKCAGNFVKRYSNWGIGLVV